MKHIPNLAVQKCCGCKESLRNKNRNKKINRIGNRTIERIRSFFNDQTIKLNDLICRKCISKSDNRRINISSHINQKSIDDYNQSRVNKW
jgi:hypothetical protein